MYLGFVPAEIYLILSIKICPLNFNGLNPTVNSTLTQRSSALPGRWSILANSSLNRINCFVSTVSGHLSGESVLLVCSELDYELHNMKT